MYLDVLCMMHRFIFLDLLPPIFIMTLEIMFFPFSIFSFSFKLSNYRVKRYRVVLFIRLPSSDFDASAREGSSVTSCSGMRGVVRKKNEDQKTGHY